ncbi:ParA family protein [Xanthomonas hortorum]|uniref:ParA family protein n=3 Tax=Xanthomonas hortorum TaxID=56454 RepID=UPI002113C5BA|nr:ParA family protein [Xanthomonas hortorum]UUF02111.1 ParA family protein [Xanthomonas hortorum pv. pelargonii]
MLTYAIWNNKGGTGKTSLAFQTICKYAKSNPTKRILAIDICPQANMSELFLGGLQNGGSGKLLERQGMTPRCSIGGYFDLRMPSVHQIPSFNAKEYITSPWKYNSSIPKSIDLVCGDPLLELQAIAMNSLANLQLPGVNTWLGVIDWLRDFLARIDSDYDIVFIDTNPSFSMYTQIVLAAADRVVLPVMADDSSRRAIQNAFSLIYGLKLPSKVYEQYTFASKMKVAGRSLPKVHLILKNRLTQYMGSASAYAAVLSGIDTDLIDLVNSYGEHFTFNKVTDGIVEIRDFGTTGVVAFARGTPFDILKTGKLNISGHRVEVNKDYRDLAIKAINSIATKL